jgi:hypothetical protein
MATIYTSTGYGPYTPNITLPAPSVWYDFSQGNGNENFSTTIKDISGNGHDGIVTGMTAANNYLPNEFSTGALHINNTNNYNGGQYISIPSSFYSSARQTVIVCMGLYRMGHLTNYSGFKNVYCGSRNTSNGKYWYFGLNSSGSPTLEFSDGSNVDTTGVTIFTIYPAVVAFDISALSNYNYCTSQTYYNNQIYRYNKAIVSSNSSNSWETFQSYGMSIGRSFASNYEYSNVKIGHIALWDNIDPVTLGGAGYESPILSGLCSAYMKKYLKLQ